MCSLLMAADYSQNLPRIKLSLKLYLSLICVSALVSSGIFCLMQVSFDRGFARYIHQNERQHLKEISAFLSKKYEQHGGWGWVDGDSEWLNELITTKVFSDTEKRSNPKKRNYIAEDHTFQIFNKDKTPVVGGIDLQKPPFVEDIIVGGESVGQVGVHVENSLIKSMNVEFIKGHQRFMLLSTIGLVICAAFLAIPVAYVIVKPINALRDAMEALAQGKEPIWLDESRSDEIGLMNHDFNRLRKKIDSQEQLRKQWLADIAHELRTPISVLKSELEAIEDGVRPLNVASIKSLQDDVNRITRLINDLHQLSLEDSGALEYQFRLVDISQLLKTFLANHKNVLHRQGFEWSYHVDTDSSLVAGDPDRLEQLLLNLFSNSLRYTEEPKRLRITVLSEGDDTVILWEDSSPGVSDIGLTSIFERLYRENKVRNDVKDASGLGLSIVETIIQKHGGNVSATHSSLGGLCVKVKLPRSH